MNEDHYGTMRERLEHERKSAHQIVDELRDHIERHGEHVSRHPAGAVVLGYRKTAEQFKTAWPEDPYGDDCIRDADALERRLPKP